MSIEWLDEIFAEYVELGYKVLDLHAAGKIDHAGFKRAADEWVKVRQAVTSGRDLLRELVREAECQDQQ